MNTITKEHSLSTHVWAGEEEGPVVVDPEGEVIWDESGTRAEVHAGMAHPDGLEEPFVRRDKFRTARRLQDLRGDR